MQPTNKAAINYLMTYVGRFVQYSDRRLRNTLALKTYTKTQDRCFLLFIQLTILVNPHFSFHVKLVNPKP